MPFKKALQKYTDRIHAHARATDTQMKLKE